MARFIIQNKVYDTDKMQFVGIVRYWFPYESFLMKATHYSGAGKCFKCKLYRSAKGNFLLVHKNDRHQINGHAITEYTAKQLILSSRNYDAYVNLYGELEEA